MEIATRNQNPIPTFLTLPVEIRFQIYALLTHQPQSGQRPRKSSPAASVPRIDTAPFSSRNPKYPHTWNERWNSAFLQYKPTSLGALRATNGQLFHETTDFVLCPQLSMNITADYKVENSMLETIAEAREQLLRMCKGEVVAVGLYYRCCDRGIHCLHHTNDECGHVSKRYVKPSWFSIASTCLDFLIRSKRPQPLDAGSFHAAIRAAGQFPHLEFLHVSFSHGDMLEWFDNPAEAMAVFADLMRRGVRVTLGVPVMYNRRAQSFLPFCKISWVLEQGTGEIVLRSIDGNLKCLCFRGKEEEWVWKFPSY